MWAVAVAAVLMTMTGCAAIPTAPAVPTVVEPSPASPHAIAHSADGPIVTIGDSIVAGSGLDPDDAWPAVLSQQTGAEITNLACDGAGFVVVGDCGSDFADLAAEAIALHPSLVIVQGSDNDLAEDRGAIRESTRDMIDDLHAALPDTLIVGLSTLWNQPASEPEAIAWSSEALRSAVHAAHGVFIDIGQPLRDDPGLLQWDLEHPTAMGQLVLASDVRDALTDAGISL